MPPQQGSDISFLSGVFQSQPLIAMSIISDLERHSDAIYLLVQVCICSKSCLSWSFLTMSHFHDRHMLSF